MVAEDTFVIDDSIGNQLKVELSYVLPNRANSELIVTYDGTTIFQSELDEDEKFAILTYDKLLEVVCLKLNLLLKYSN